ncbi:hypothetical protein, partial [Piscinibacter koreensis]
RRAAPPACRRCCSPVHGNQRDHVTFNPDSFRNTGTPEGGRSRLANGVAETRTELLKKFDEIFAIEGARFQNKKFELIDAVNNSLKHIQLDRKRYPELVRLYGDISFNSLVPDGKRVLCILEGYRFDYARVVLRPAIDALTNWHLEDAESVLELASGNVTMEGTIVDHDFDDPIDAMIAYANPTCDDCGESSDFCACETYTYDGKAGIFTSNFSKSFDFDSVMSRISGSYRNS